MDPAYPLLRLTSSIRHGSFSDSPYVKHTGHSPIYTGSYSWLTHFTFQEFTKIVVILPTTNSMFKSNQLQKATFGMMFIGLNMDQFILQFYSY